MCISSENFVDDIMSPYHTIYVINMTEDSIRENLHNA